MAVAAAEHLKNTIILNGSVLDETMLNEADIRDADMMIALTNDDQVNILVQRACQASWLSAQFVFDQ